MVFSITQFDLVLVGFCFSYVLHLTYHVVRLVQLVLVVQKVLLGVAQILDSQTDLDSLTDLSRWLLILGVHLSNHHLIV